MKFTRLTFFLCLVLLVSLSRARLIVPLPQPLPSFKINNTLAQSAGTCPYTISIKTSCSSSRYTRDRISLSFGDAHGYQVHVPRLDDPSSRTFESCSTDTFHVNGPCTYQICYLYVYRSGHDGWKPDSITVTGYHSSTVTFYFKTFIPVGVWYGFNHCNAASAST